MNYKTKLINIAVFLSLFLSFAGCGTSSVRRGSSDDVSSDQLKWASSKSESEISSGPMRGLASWYGRRHHGRRTASGERFDKNAMTAAHRTLPFGTMVEVKNLRNGKTVVVKINDRGPHKKNRIIDLSYAAARKLGITRTGLGQVELRPKT